jgi:protease-4
VFTTLATTVFGLSLAANVYLLLASGLFRSSGDSARQTVLVSGDPKQKIVVVRVGGIIDDQVMSRFEKMMKKAEADPDLKALVLEIDTPGGSVSASDQMYARVLKFKEDKRVPVVAAMGGVAASGGYYISCAADKIVAQRTTITGSIGVLLPRYDLSKLAQRWGIEDNSLHSTGASYKTAGSWLRSETEQERQYLLAILDDAFGTFKDVVSRGRGKALTRSIDQVADGRAFTASQALSYGLVDQIGYSSTAFYVAASLAGNLSNKHVVRYEPIPSLLDALGVESSTANPDATKTVTINGVNVNIDRNWLDELMTPRVMYLWRGQ